MRHTWYKRTSDGTFFRNCPLIMAEQERAISPVTAKRLSDEWWKCFRQGVIKSDTLPRGDRWTEYDDSPEATRAWVTEFMQSRGHFDYEPRF